MPIKYVSCWTCEHYQTIPDTSARNYDTTIITGYNKKCEFGYYVYYLIDRRRIPTICDRYKEKASPYP